MLDSFVILIDSREQLPYRFADLTKARGGSPLIVPTRRGTLASGDYAIVDRGDDMAVERKSLGDLFQSIGQERGRFEREIQRLSAMRYAAVVVEADWETICSSPPEQTRLTPKTIYRTVLAWQLAYPSVHWWMCPGRRFAEWTTYRLLERYWRWFTIHEERWEPVPEKTIS